MRIPTIGLVFHSWMGPKGPYTSKVSTATLLSYNQNTVIHSIQVFGSLQTRSLGLGHYKRDSDWYFYTLNVIYYFKI